MLINVDLPLLLLSVDGSPLGVCTEQLNSSEVGHVAKELLAV